MGALTKVFLPEEWRRWRRIACNIVTITDPLSFGWMTEAHLDIFNASIAQRLEPDGQPMCDALLPRIRHLSLYGGSNTSLTCNVAALLLSPSLRSLNLRATCGRNNDSHEEGCPVLEHLQANGCPNLERLHLDATQTFDHDQDLVKTLTAFKNLRSFYCTASRAETSLNLDTALSVLAQLPLLRDLQIEPYWHDERKKPCLRQPLSSEGFPELRRLSSFQEIVDAFLDHATCMRALEELEIHCKIKGFTNSLIPGYQLTINKIGNQCPNLRHFRLDLPQTNPRQIFSAGFFERKVAKGWDPESPRPLLTKRELENLDKNPFFLIERLSLRPFTKCPQLEALVLNAPTDVFKLTDKDVAVLAPAWPRLKRIQLLDVKDPEYKNTVGTLSRERTTASLAYFSIYCKELEEFDFFLSVCSGTSAGLEPMSNIRKLKLRPVSNPETPLPKAEVCTWLRGVCKGLGWAGNPARVMAYSQPDSLRSQGMYYSVEERDFR